MLMCLHVVCGCFCTTKTELSVCNGDDMAKEAENIYYLALYIKSLLTPARGKYNHIGSYKLFRNPDGSILS